MIYLLKFSYVCEQVFHSSARKYKNVGKWQGSLRQRSYSIQSQGWFTRFNTTAFFMSLLIVTLTIQASTAKPSLYDYKIQFPPTQEEFHIECYRLRNTVNCDCPRVMELHSRCKCPLLVQYYHY